MSVDTIEKGLRPLVESYYTKSKAIKSNPKYKTKNKASFFENYLLVSATISDLYWLKRWVIQEMTQYPGDVLLISNDNDVREFKTFTSDLYKGVTQARFDKINPRVFKFNELPKTVYKSPVPYKVMVLGLTTARFKSKLFVSCSAIFPDAVLIVGNN